jgi:hypothetical protein
MGNHVLAGRDNYWRFFQPMTNHDTAPGINLEHAISTALKRALIMTFRDTLLTKQTTVTTGRIVKDQYGGYERVRQQASTRQKLHKRRTGNPLTM